MKYTIIINDQPYGSEKPYNALRLAISFSNRPNTELRVFLMADAVSCAKSGQETPSGYYNLARMLKSLTSKNISISACGSCMDARGLKPEDLFEGVHKSNMDELTDWTIWADKVITF